MELWSFFDYCSISHSTASIWNEGNLYVQYYLNYGISDYQPKVRGLHTLNLGSRSFQHSAPLKEKLLHWKS